MVDALRLRKKHVPGVVLHQLRKQSVDNANLSNYFQSTKDRGDVSA